MHPTSPTQRPGMRKGSTMTRIERNHLRGLLGALLSGPATVVVLALVLISLTACGGGSGADETLAGQCYVAGQARPDADCQPMATIQPVACNASGVCR